jgi:hypothetical protein
VCGLAFQQRTVAGAKPSLGQYLLQHQNTISLYQTKRRKNPRSWKDDFSPKLFLTETLHCAVLPGRPGTSSIICLRHSPEPDSLDGTLWHGNQTSQTNAG